MRIMQLPSAGGRLINTTRRRESLMVPRRGGTHGRVILVQESTTQTNFGLLASHYEDLVYHVSQTQSPGEGRPKQLPSTAEQWMEQNSRKLAHHVGKWVAISARGVVAVGSSLAEVLQTAKVRGVSDPLVYKVPKPSGPRIVSLRQP